MKKSTVSALFAIPLIVGASVSVTPMKIVYHSEYALTSEAMILIPVQNAEYADLATTLYLDPLGFSGTVTTLNVPEVISGMNLDQTVQTDVQDLVDAVEQQFKAGDFSSADPLYIFGYSQSAVAASLAEQQLANDDIPSADLHFVFVGDTASAHGGFLNSFVDSLPESLQQPATETFNQFGAGDVLGATTPDNLYPTDVYSLSADGWANWDNGANLFGMLVDHLEYLGLTPEEVNSATLSFTNDLSDYFTIDSANVDNLSALWESLMMALSVF